MFKQYLYFLGICFLSIQCKSIENKENLVEKILNYENNQQYQKAVDLANELIREDSTQSYMYVIRGRNRRYLHLDSLSLKDFSIAIALDTNNVSAYFQKAFLFSIIQNDDSAIKNYNLAILHKTSGGFIFNMENQDKLKFKNQTDIKLETIIFYRGISFYEKQMDSVALQDFYYALNHQYNTGDCQFYIGVILISENQKEGCYYLKEAIKNGQNNAEKYLREFCK